jgi:hypothetical protein
MGAFAYGLLLTEKQVEGGSAVIGTMDGECRLLGRWRHDGLLLDHVWEPLASLEGG